MQAKLIGAAIALVLLFQCGLAQLGERNNPDQGNLTWDQASQMPVTGQITATVSEGSATAGFATLAILALVAIALRTHVKKLEMTIVEG